MPLQNFHSYYLDVLKKYFKASYISWIEEKGNKSLMIRIGQESKIFPFEGNITEDTYRKLISDLIQHGEKS